MCPLPPTKPQAISPPRTTNISAPKFHEKGSLRLGPLRETIIPAEADHLLETDGFPDWDYVPPDDEGHPFEYKASDWGRLPDGRLVALDYFAPALGDPDEQELLGRRLASAE